MALSFFYIFAVGYETQLKPQKTNGYGQQPSKQDTKGACDARSQN